MHKYKIPQAKNTCGSLIKFQVSAAMTARSSAVRSCRRRRRTMTLRRGRCHHDRTGLNHYRRRNYHHRCRRRGRRHNHRSRNYHRRGRRGRCHHHRSRSDNSFYQTNNTGSKMQPFVVMMVFSHGFRHNNKHSSCSQQANHNLFHKNCYLSLIEFFYDYQPCG